MGLLDKEQKQIKYDMLTAAAKQYQTQVPVKKGCANKQCFCTGACQEILYWRDKTPDEIREENRIPNQ